jgi:hypothetical protein
MHLDDAVMIEPRSLELSIHIRCENEGAVPRPPGPSLKDLETGMWASGAVEIKPVTVETPCQCRVRGEPAWIRQGDEIEPELLVRRVGAPESFVPSEVGKSGIDAHSGPGTDQEGFRRCHALCGAL